MSIDWECEVCGQRATRDVEWKSSETGKVEKHFYCNECYLQVNPQETIAKNAEWYSEISASDVDTNDDDEEFDECFSSDEEEKCNCPQCRAERGEPILPEFFGDIGNLIACQIFGLEQVVRANKKEKKKAPQKEIPAVYCPSCGLSLKEITATQKAGCPKCYQTFDSVLMQKHSRFSDGKHYGGKDYKSKLFFSDIDYMQNELNTAVRNQDFERAAYFRDGMKKLQSKAASVDNE